MTPLSVHAKHRSVLRLRRQVRLIVSIRFGTVTDLSIIAAHSAQLSYEMTMKSVAMLHRLASSMNRR